jgi:hypothetical protein
MSETIALPVGRILYPQLFEKGEYSGKEFYGAQLVFDKEYLKNNPEELKLWKQFKQVCNDVCEAAFRKPLGTPGIKNPFDPPAVPYDLEKYPYYENAYVLNARNYNFQPDVVDARLQPILDKALIYGGCYVRAGIQVYASPKHRTIALSLQAIKKERDGEPIGGGRVSASSLFSAFKSDEPIDTNDTSFLDEDFV